MVDSGSRDGDTEAADLRVIRGRMADASDAPTTGETFTDLVTIGNVRIETIHSSATPDTGLYDQDHDEWVMLVDGSAELETEGRSLVLSTGDWVFIGAGVEHRVASTRHGTRWIAVHVDR